MFLIFDGIINKHGVINVERSLDSSMVIVLIQSF